MERGSFMHALNNEAKKTQLKRYTLVTMFTLLNYGNFQVLNVPTNVSSDNSSYISKMYRMH